MEAARNQPFTLASSTASAASVRATASIMPRLLRNRRSASGGGTSSRPSFRSVVLRCGMATNWTGTCHGATSRCAARQKYTEGARSVILPKSGPASEVRLGERAVPQSSPTPAPSPDRARRRASESRLLVGADGALVADATNTRHRAPASCRKPRRGPAPVRSRRRPCRDAPARRRTGRSPRRRPAIPAAAAAQQAGVERVRIADRRASPPAIDRGRSQLRRAHRQHHLRFGGRLRSPPAHDVRLRPASGGSSASRCRSPGAAGRRQRVASVAAPLIACRARCASRNASTCSSVAC